MRKSRAVNWIMALGVTAVLAGCSNDTLHDMRTDEPGPDEFSIIPSKPLTAPETYAALPAPTPGGSNLTDQQPLQEAVVALGGRASATVETNGASANDGGLVNYVSRFGVPAGVRQTAAVEDEGFRKRRGRFLNIKLVKQDRYNDVYKRQTLDQKKELWRWRRAGALTPTAPPGGLRRQR